MSDYCRRQLFFRVHLSLSSALCFEWTPMTVNKMLAFHNQVSEPVLSTRHTNYNCLVLSNIK